MSGAEAPWVPTRPSCHYDPLPSTNEIITLEATKKRNCREINFCSKPLADTKMTIQPVTWSSAASDRCKGQWLDTKPKNTTTDYFQSPLVVQHLPRIYGQITIPRSVCDDSLSTDFSALHHCPSPDLVRHRWRAQPLSILFQSLISLSHSGCFCLIS